MRHRLTSGRAERRNTAPPGGPHTTPAHQLTDRTPQHRTGGRTTYRTGGRTTYRTGTPADRPNAATSHQLTGQKPHRLNGVRPNAATPHQLTGHTSGEA